MISTLVNEQIAHYEYTNGFLEFHLESEYNSNDFNYLFYRYLRENIYTGTGDYKWHKWFGMKQGRVRYEYYIEDQLDLADALSQMIPYIDSIVSDYLKNNDSSFVDENELTSEDVFKNDDVYNNVMLNKVEHLPEPDNMKVSELHSNVICLKDIHFEHLKIPEYQRPYKWNTKHVNQLISDLLTFRDKKEYRLSSFCLHKVFLLQYVQ
jgi:hypothetical protein